MHVSRLKRVVKLSYRPYGEFVVDRAYRIDFKKPLVPEDSLKIELDADEYEVKEILDVRSELKTRGG